MGQITLNYEDAMRVLTNPESGADAKVIAACTVAFFEVNDHADEIERDTRAIVLKLSHMTADVILGDHEMAPGEEED